MRPAEPLRDTLRSPIDPPAKDRLLGWPRVKDRVDISRTTAWRLEKRGDFPKSVQVSPGRVAWRESEIDAWKSSRCPRDSAPPSKRPAQAERPKVGPSKDTPPPPPTAQPTHSPCPTPDRRPSKPKGPDQIAFEF